MRQHDQRDRQLVQRVEAAQEMFHLTRLLRAVKNEDELGGTAFRVVGECIQLEAQEA